jgi:hypothetical protein
MRRPRLERAVPDARFPKVIDHEGLMRQTLDQRQRRGQLPRKHQDVVRQTETPELADAPDHVLAREKVVRLRLRDVTHASEPRVSDEGAKRIFHSRRREVHPADDAPDEGVLAREIEQEARLVLRLIGLHRDAPVDAIRREDAFKIRRQEIAPDRSQVVRDPAIARSVESPEMLMGVDLHCSRGPTPARAARLAALARRAAGAFHCSRGPTPARAARLAALARRAAGAFHCSRGPTSLFNAPGPTPGALAQGCSQRRMTRLP